MNFNTSLAKEIAREYIPHNDSETIRVHGIGIKFHKQSHRPKALIVSYDVWRKNGKVNKIVQRDKEKQIKLKSINKIIRFELFKSPMMICGLKENY